MSKILGLTRHMEQISSHVDWIIVHEPIRKHIKRTSHSFIYVDDSPKQFWGHPLTQEGIINSSFGILASHMNQMSILIDQTSPEINRQVHRRVAISNNSAIWGSNHFLDKFSFSIKYCDWSSIMVSTQIISAKRRKKMLISSLMIYSIQCILSKT